MDRLTSLHVRSNSNVNDKIVLLQLNDFINKAPCLHSLIINNWNPSAIQDLPWHIISNSICRLDLQSGHYLKHDRCFNSEQCAAFLRSSWTKQCEILEIVVNDQSMIDDLINSMSNLKALEVMLQTGRQDDHFPNREEMIVWMASQYSRTFAKNIIDTETMQFWIR
ncbi:unnamed protein product [Rotaria sordida]|uniref:Uncharacterized protein n=1 Tax=Rotaria sordida TaxID=392033 RepID=A0A820BDX0_9BILA|nr:unnamed protein product [Rotaria sordida]